MSRFVISAGVFARDWIRQLLDVRFGVSALYLSGLDYAPWHDALSSPRVDPSPCSSHLKEARGASKAARYPTQLERGLKGIYRRETPLNVQDRGRAHLNLASTRALDGNGSRKHIL